MTETKRIDQYLCIDVDKLVVDEMRDILCMEPHPDAHPDDVEYMTTLRKAARVIMSRYEVIR